MPLGTAVVTVTLTVSTLILPKLSCGATSTVCVPTARLNPLLYTGLVQLPGAVVVGALRLVGQDLGDLLTNLAQEIRVNTEGRLVSFLLEQASLVDDHMLRRFSIFVFCYAVVGLVEGVGLMLEKRWAEYLTAIITGSFLPLEILELMRRVTAFRVGLFVVNLAVLIYLVLHLHAGLKGNRAEAGEDTADNENVDSSR